MGYERAKIAVDAVIFTIHRGKLSVLLHKREKPPFRGRLELPGGLLQEGETAEQTIERKLHDIVGTSKIFLKQFRTFTQPKRDPRGRVVSIGFIALVREQPGLVWHPCDTLSDLAFDHQDIVREARRHLKERVSPDLVRQFMPKEFPLNQLQAVYEIVEDESYDNRNFRKRMLSAEIVEETGRKETNVSHRPAKLYRFA